MALNPSDTNLKLLFGLDESGPTATRVNSGNWGSAVDLVPYTDDADPLPGEGVPTTSDGLSGKAANIHHDPGGVYSNDRRWLESAAGEIDSGWAYAPKDPADFLEDEAIVFGCRFNWHDFHTGTGGGVDVHYIWGCHPLYTELRQVYIGIQPDSNTSPATGGQLRIQYGNSNIGGVMTAASHAISGSPPTEYIDTAATTPYSDAWYSVVVRMKRTGVNELTLTTFLLKEATGSLYIFEDTSTFNADFGAAFTGEDIAWCVGCPISSTGRRSHSGSVDQAWYYEGDLTDDEITTIVEDGIQIPWVAPSYTYNDHDVRVAHTNESASFPIPRDLPAGTLACFHPAGAWGSRLRLWYEGTRASRPWSLRRSEIQFDTAGPRGQRRNAAIVYENSNLGLIRRAGRLPDGSVVDTRNMEFWGLGPRRRRGFKIRRDVDSTSEVGKNAFISWRSANDELHRLYKASDQLFAETGSAATSISTGWSRQQQPSFGVLDDRLIVLTASKQVLWRGNTDGVDSFGEEAPTGGSVSATTGTLTGTYVYAYTFYDPITGDETAPTIIGSVALSGQGALLSSLDTSPTDSRFTQQRIYRSTADGAAPLLFFIDSQNNASSYTDGPTSAADGTQQIGVVGSDYITLVPPDTFAAVTVHQERAFYYQAQSNPTRVYWSEANDPSRFWSESFVTFEAPVNAVLGIPQGLLVLTDRTVEVLESDFIRDANGSYNLRRTVLSRTVGCPGPNAITDVRGQPYWIDRRGIYTLLGDRVERVSRDIDNLFPFLNIGLADVFSVDWNHIRDQLWFCVALSDQDDNARQQTQIVMQLGEQVKWGLYDLEATFCSQFDDDLNGQRFGIIDHLGVFKEMESNEGDGVDDPSDETNPEGSITSISGSVVTVTGAGWTTDEHRGKGVLLRDVSKGAETALHYYTIVSNTSDTFTCERAVNTDLAADDEYEIGGMKAYLEFSEQNMGTSNKKVGRFLHHEFDDLTAGRFV